MEITRTYKIIEQLTDEDVMYRAELLRIYFLTELIESWLYDIWTHGSAEISLELSNKTFWIPDKAKEQLRQTLQRDISSLLHNSLDPRKEKGEFKVELIFDDSKSTITMISELI